MFNLTMKNNDNDFLNKSFAKLVGTYVTCYTYLLPSEVNHIIFNKIVDKSLICK